MLKKSQRLTTKEFQFFWQHGKKHHSPLCTMVTAPHHSRKVAVVVGKKVAKTAVLRNRLRRQGYGVVAQCLTEVPYNGALIIVVKPPFLTLTHADRRQVLATQLMEVLRRQ